MRHIHLQGYARAFLFTCATGLMVLQSAVGTDNQTAEAGANPDSETVLFSIHPALPADAASAPEQEDATMLKMPYRGAEWWIRSEPELSVSAGDIQKVELEYGGSTVKISFFVRENAASAFTKLTDKYTGAFLAMMHDGKLVSLAQVPRAIESPVIQTMALKDDAEALLGAVRSAGLQTKEESRYERIQDEGFKEAVALLEQGDLEGAAAVYRRLLENIPEDDPRSLVYKLSLARVLLQNNDLEGAKELLDQMVVLPMTAQNREVIFSAFLMSIDLMEALNQFSLRNVYLRQALGKLGELAKQEDIDPQIRAWAELSAAYLHLRYMDIALVEDSLTEENRALLPDLWFTLSAYLKEMNGDSEGAREVYEQWLAARPEQAEVIHARLANLNLGRPNITRSKIARAMDEAASKMNNVEPANQAEDPAPIDEQRDSEPDSGPELP